MNFKIKWAQFLLFFILSFVFTLNLVNYYDSSKRVQSELSIRTSELLETRQSLLESESIWLNQGNRFQNSVTNLYQKWALSIWLTLKGNKELKKPNFPITDSLAVYYAAKGRFRKHWGNDFDEFFIRNWKTHFFLGTKAGGVGFEQKALYLYPRPLTHSEFLRQLGKIQWLRFGSTNLGLIAFHDDDHTLLTILDLSKLSRNKLLNWVNKELKSLGIDLIKPSEVSPGFENTLPDGFKSSSDNGIKSPLSDSFQSIFNSITRNEKESGSWKDQSGYKQARTQQESQGDWKLAFCCVFIALLLTIVFSSQLFQSRFFLRLALIYVLVTLLILSFGFVWKAKMLEVEKRSIHEELLARYQSQTKKFEINFTKYLEIKAEQLNDASERLKQRQNLRAGSYHFEFRENGEFKFSPDTMSDYLKEVFLRSAPILLTSSFSKKSRDELGRLFETRFSNEVLPISESEIDNIASSLVGHKSSEFYEFHVLNWGFYWYWNLIEVAGETVFFGVSLQKEDLITQFLEEQQLISGLEVRELWIQRRSQLKEHYHWKNHNEEPSAQLSKAILVGHEEMDQGLDFRMIGETPYIFCRVSSQVFREYSFNYLIPQNLAYEGLTELKQTFNLLVFLYLFLSIFLYWFLSRGMTNFVKELQISIQAQDKEVWSKIKELAYDDERASLIETYLSMREELLQRDKLMPFVAHQLLQILKREDGSYGTEIESNAAVVFCDVRSFTTISENYAPVEIVAMLNEYFELWEEVVQNYGGIIDKFIGDAVEVIFFEKEHTDFTQRAIDCSRELMLKFEIWNQKRANSGELTIQNGIGIAVSSVRFGVIGDEHKKHFLALGDAVELAEELEAKTKLGNRTKIFVQKAIANTLPKESFQILREGQTEFYELI